MQRDSGCTKSINPGVQRFLSYFSWPSLKTILAAIIIAGMICSVFELAFNPGNWLNQIINNYIQVLCVAFFIILLFSFFNPFSIKNIWLRLLAVIFWASLSGVMGGFLAWCINNIIMNFYISHPLRYMFLVVIFSNLFVLSIFAYRALSLRLQETAERLAEKEINEQKLIQLTAKAELTALRAKINPHFLFNTLNAIASLIPDDPSRAEEVVQKLAWLFQYTLNTSDKALVPLRQELDFVRSYLEIEKTRLGERLFFNIQASDAVLDTRFPCMLLQPLVENSVKYGIAPKTAGGRIDLDCRLHNGRCQVRIEDSGSGFDSVSAEEGFGISSVRERLHCLYKNDHSFSLSADNGVSIYIDIPSSI
ncbi:MAG: histidine kinase [Myxococcota bacterium]|nr:histidine kinase [Myxococcota bacterium]